MNLNEQELDLLHEELSSEDLQVYTVVVMGKRDLDSGNLHSCMLRLRVDSDKLRSHEALYSLIMKYFDMD
jgi:hypothetical protein